MHRLPIDLQDPGPVVDLVFDSTSDFLIMLDSNRHQVLMETVSSTYLCRTTAEAPPPPLQMVATPDLPSCLSSTLSSRTRRAAPVAPMGCPSAVAPPCTLTLQNVLHVLTCAHLSMMEGV